MSARNAGDRPENRPLNVLVVDDSAVVRQVMTTLLSDTPDMSVVAAPDPIIALDKMRRQRPDVILLDIEMPRMDGLTFLRHVMSSDPIPVVICSAHTDAGTDVAFRALEEGAVEIFTKPKLGVQQFLEESATRLVDAIRAASVARLSLLARRYTLAVKERPAPGKPMPALDVAAAGRGALEPVAGSESLIAVGASTGGTEALREFLSSMPPDAPGVVVVQHMPEHFTRAFAERLDRICPVAVKEASHGDRVAPGHVLIAPGNRHLLVHKSGGQYVTEVRDGALVSRHRPSVDVLFRSVAAAAGPNAVGVIMTGMGDDGASGLLEMRAAGAVTLAQDEASSVVFGMPREAIERGAVDSVLPLAQLAAAALSRARSAARDAPN